jgi:hypothetical protein
MARRQFSSGFDAKISQVTERAIRRMSRRNILRTVFVSGAASIAAISVGETPALADDCTRHCGPTSRCRHCRPTECPHGYVLCKGSFVSDCFNHQGYRCEWPAGLWIACTGLGHGYGYKICKDCIFRDRCNDWCTCLTDCICCGCRNAADFKEEQYRLQVLLSSSDS